MKGKIELDDISFDDLMDELENKEETTNPLDLELEDDDKDDSTDQNDDTGSDLSGQEEDDKTEPDPANTTGAIDDEDVAPGVIDTVLSRLGYELEGEFEESEEGIVDLVKAASEKLAESQLDKIFEQYPALKEFAEYQFNGGDPEKFFKAKFPEVDFTTITEIDDEDITLQERLVKEALAIKGFDNEDIENSVEEFRGAGILHSQAQRALKALQKYQTEEKSKIIETQKQVAAEEKQRVEKFWSEVNTTIDKAVDLKGFVIPEKDKGDFFDYIAKPVNAGYSQRDVDVNELDLEERLMLDYLVYNIKKKKVNISTLIDRKAATKQALSLRDKLGKQTDKLNSKTPDKVRGNRQSKTSIDDVDFDRLI
jgi:hypothetical protein